MRLTFRLLFHNLILQIHVYCTALYDPRAVIACQIGIEYGGAKEAPRATANVIPISLVSNHNLNLLLTFLKREFRLKGQIYKDEDGVRKI